MKQIFKYLFILVILCFSLSDVVSQSYDFNCGTLNPKSGANNSVSSPFTGLYKPTRSDLNNAPNDAYFPILVVFVQFKDEANDPHGTWLQNKAPRYLDSMIARAKNTNSNTPFWQLYDQNSQRLSSHWAEISRGGLHVISPSGAFSVVLPYTALEYWIASGENQSVSENLINQDIWTSVRQQGLTDWRYYDRWKKVGDQFYFCPLGEGDGYVDMVYKIHKTTGGFMYNGVYQTALWDKAGYSALSSTYHSPELVDPQNNIYMEYSYSEAGSGVTISYRTLADNYIATIGHEHMHMLAYPGHVTYSRACYGFGFDYFFSPYDMIINNYMSPTSAVINGTNYLSDYSSRNAGSGNILQVAIEGNQSFLLANRTKVSKWDRVMTGDTAQLYPFNDNSEYGKGLYIYHIENGIYRPSGDISPQDMECADGYYEWEYQGTGPVDLAYECFTSPQSNWPYYKKKSVLYTNDPSIISNPNPYGDEISFHHNVNNTNWPCWWGFGIRPSSNCELGTEHLNTYKKDVFTLNPIGGDRYDVWRPGYNEMFSPYSSPSTVKWNNENSGLFIYYKGYDIYGNAEIDIRKVDATHTLESILEATPPSRPMGLTLDTCFDAGNGISYIKLNWVHNMEPDMERGSKVKYKRYKIYRSFSTNSSTVPPDSYLYPENHYTNIATVDINSSVTPSFVDSVNSPKIFSVCTYLPDVSCPPICYNLVNVRYRVQAVDIYDSVSRLSDFDQCQGYRRDSVGGIPIGSGEDFLPHKGNTGDKIIPKEFKLYQNFPNPFNPNTNISYDIPYDCFVTIKIYDVSGREIKSLVNEFIKAGSYITGFNGSGLASGVYFYKIKAGSFIQTKRMALIK